MPVPSMAVATAPKTSPSLMRRMRAPACADLADEVHVAVALEDAHDEVLDVALERLGDVADVLGGGGVDVDRVGGLGTDGDLLHVRVGRVQQRALRAEREHRERVGLAVRGQVRALERVDGDVDLLAAPADLLADVEHRRLVALALADDDRAGDVDVVERLAHALDGGVVGGVLVALAHPAAGGERRSLGDLEHLDDPGVAHASSLIVPATPMRRARLRPTATRTSRATKCPSGPPGSGSDRKNPSAVTNRVHSSGTPRPQWLDRELPPLLAREKRRDDLVVLRIRESAGGVHHETAGAHKTCRLAQEQAAPSAASSSISAWRDAPALLRVPAQRAQTRARRVDEHGVDGAVGRQCLRRSVRSVASPVRAVTPGTP